MFIGDKMEELKVTPKELKQLIDDSKMIGQGFFGTVFQYKNHLIKLDKVLYSLLRSNHEIFADEVFKDHYRFNREDMVNPKQIEILASKQKDITLTQMPKGIVRVGEHVPGIIIPYHENHQNLSLLPKDDYITLLKVLRKLLLSVKELADNEIAHHDLVHSDKWGRNRDYNILYKGDTPQIIDIEGDFIACGENFKDAEEMYNQLGNIVLGYFKTNGLTTNLTDDMITDSKKAGLLIDELEDRLHK